MVTNDIQFKELVDNLKVCVYRSTPGSNGRFVFVNKAFLELFGFSQDEVAKLNVVDIYENSRKLGALNDRVQSQGYVQNEEMRLRSKDKALIWCSVSKVAVKDSKGKIKWFDVIVEDISVRKSVEKELVESKELFKVVFDNSAAAITVTDKHERIIAWNPFAEKMLEMGKEDLFNKPVRDLYPAREWRRMRSFRIRKKGMLSDIETQILKNDGSLLDVNMSISVLKDVDGNVTGSIGIMRDITNQKIAERKMRESENKIRIILDNSAAAITLTDENERIISWNKFTEQLLGMKRNDIYMKQVSSLYPDEEWRKIRAENIRKTGSKHHLETKIIRKDGKIIDIDLSINVLKDSDNKIVGSVGIMQDITEQKRFQQMLMQAKLAAEEANSAKSLFLANMSHEVRTPMSTIIGMIDLTLDDTGLNEEQQENLQVAKDAADNLLSLLNDILDLSRVEAGKINLEAIEFNLYNVVKSVLKGLSVLAHKKNLELIYDIDPRIPEVIIGDPVRLRQVLVNLINNGIKFTHKGNIETVIKVESISSTECDLLIAVKDQGIGIPKDKHELIFDVFTQADVSTTRRYGGTGLGLAISKKLVEMMNGRIWVESEMGKGSTFYFTTTYKIPAPDVSHRSLALLGGDDKESGEVYAKDIKKLSILLAEDNPVNQKIVEKMLEKKGWKVHSVFNGQEAMDVLSKNSFDCILMDAHMPILDGVEATKLIREDEKKTGKHIPIVALTARAMDEDRKKLLASGMDDYVSKPIDRQLLFEVIQGLFRKGRFHE